VDSDRQILKDTLDAGYQAEVFERSEFWRETVKPALDRLAAQTQEKLEGIDPLKDPTEIIRLQERIKVYRYFVPNLMAAMKVNAEAAYANAQEQGMIHTLEMRHGQETH